MKRETISIIGTGKMGSAIGLSFLERGLFKPGQVLVCDRERAALDSFAKSAGREVRATTHLSEALEWGDTLLLSIKPQQLSEIPVNTIAKEKLVISILAGVPLSRLKIVAEECPCIRVMPNTPLLVGCGVTAYCATEDTHSSDCMLVESIFGGVGKIYKVDESQMDAITALSGSGPAYFYGFTEALALAATKHGIPEPIAREMAIYTAAGAARMMAQSDGDLGALIAQVRSKGGTTEAALNSFQGNHWHEVIEQAFESAVRRAGELSKV